MKLLSKIKRKLSSILPFYTTTNNDVDAFLTGGPTPATESEESNERRPHKRHRLQHHESSGTATPPHLLSETTLLPSPSKLHLSKELFTNSTIDKLDQPSDLLRHLPNDVLSHCLSYLATKQSRYSLQLTCKTFCTISNEDEMLINIELGGENEVVDNVYSPSLENNNNNNNNNMQVDQNNGVGIENDDYVENNEEVGGVGGIYAAEADNAHHAEEVLVDNIHQRRQRALQSPLTTTTRRRSGGIILDTDTSVTACKKLMKFAVAGNKEAIYMIAMILCYCQENISEGLAFLHYAADTLEHLPSIYALALILRDSRSVESDYYLSWAASLNYAPAWQEKLTASEMRAQFGDLDANKLVQYLDPPCLNKLLGRHYLECQRVRKCQTSHCWNPSCGRWAYKALRVDQAAAGRPLAERQRLARIRALWNEHLNGNQDALNGIQSLHGIFEPYNATSGNGEGQQSSCKHVIFSIESLMPSSTLSNDDTPNNKNTVTEPSEPTPLEKLKEALRNKPQSRAQGLKVSRMKMCSSCRRAKYCSKLCQVYDWRSGRHKMECQFLNE